MDNLIRKISVCNFVFGSQRVESWNLKYNYVSKKFVNTFIFFDFVWRDFAFWQPEAFRQVEVATVRRRLLARERRLQRRFRWKRRDPSPETKTKCRRRCLRANPENKKLRFSNCNVILRFEAVESCTKEA